MGDPPRAKTLLVVDDHPVVALGIELALQTRPELRLVGVVTDPLDPKGAVAKNAPDALVLDLTFAGAVNLSLIRSSRERMPGAAIVVFTSLPARLYRQDAINAGADAYLTKDHDIAELITVLLDQLAKKTRAPVASQHTVSIDVLSNRIGDGTRLTPKETEIARWLSRGLSIADIAAQVGANHNTISVHRDNIRRKLGCRNSSELVARLARLYAQDADG